MAYLRTSSRAATPSSKEPSDDRARPGPVRALAIRPVPLRQLAWVAWRRNRATVLGLGGLLAALATYLVVTGLQTHAAYDDLGQLRPADHHRRLPDPVGRRS